MAYQHITDFLLHEDNNEDFLENAYSTSEMEEACENVILLEKMSGLHYYFNLLRQSEFVTACLLISYYDEVVLHLANRLTGKPIREKELLNLFKLQRSEELSKLVSSKGYRMVGSGNSFIIEKQ